MYNSAAREAHRAGSRRGAADDRVGLANTFGKSDKYIDGSSKNMTGEHRSKRRLPRHDLVYGVLKIFDCSVATGWNGSPKRTLGFLLRTSLSGADVDSIGREPLRISIRIFTPQQPIKGLK